MQVLLQTPRGKTGLGAREDLQHIARPALRKRCVIERHVVRHSTARADVPPPPIGRL